MSTNSVIESENIRDLSLAQTREESFPANSDLDNLDNAISCIGHSAAGVDIDVKSLLRLTFDTILEQISPTASATQPVQRPVLAMPPEVDDTPVNTFVESVIAVRTLVDTFYETGDYDFLDSAISTLLEIGVEDPPSDNLSNLLACLLEMQPPAYLVRFCTEHNIVCTEHSITDSFVLLMSCSYSFDSTGDIDYGNKGIETAKAMLRTVYVGDQRRPAVLAFMSMFFRDRFLNSAKIAERGGVIRPSKVAPAIADALVPSQVEDLDRAIEAITKALAEAPPDYHLRPAMSGWSSSMLHDRFQLLSVLDDLHNSISAIEEEVET